MNDPETGTFTSEEFYNKYVRTIKQSASQTEVPLDTPAPNYSREHTDLWLNDYSASVLANRTKGNFTTALNAPRIVPSEASASYEQRAETANLSAGKMYFGASNLTRHGASAGYTTQETRTVVDQASREYSPSKQYFNERTELVTNISRNGPDLNRHYEIQEVVYQTPNLVNSQVGPEDPVRQIHQLQPRITRPSSQHSETITYVQQQPVVISQAVPPSTVIRTSQVKEGEIIKGT